MLFLLLCIQAAVPVLSVAPPSAPQNIKVDNWLLTWTPGEEERDVTYTVQYRSLDKDTWEKVSACVHISSLSCNVTSAKGKAEDDCVMLRVQAERHGLTSGQVKACSRHGDTCSPEPTLTARPGSLTVHLNRNNSFATNNADRAQHRIYYGKEGEPLEEYGDTLSSVSISGLQEGQRYCIKVQYILSTVPKGMPSCIQCELIPESEPQQTGTAAAAGVGVVLLALIPVVAYILIFKRGRIKEWLRPPYEIPEDFFLEPFPEHYIISTSIPSDEQCDVISCIKPKELAD
ncbi:interferon gamma receptor 2 [Pempheris klunzingeri]|uniref:interferon gamma receptor 2 n=1 Tax=Pempheris klunzingeri TaxID=3127111 RepID=UPI00398097A9